MGLTTNMEFTAANFFAWAIAIGVTWLSVIAILAALKNDKESEGMKALWIAFIVCTPIIGPMVFWFFSPSQSQDAASITGVEAREAALKARLNNSSEKL